MTYIIAELGSVHDGSLGNALRLIEECAALGADAVKLQDHRGEKVKGDPPWFRGQEPREQYLRRTAFAPIGWQQLKQCARASKVDLVVSPFSVYAVELQEAAETVDAYKIASGQVTNLPMLEAIGKTGRRVYLSSGMTSDDETLAAGHVLVNAGCGPAVFMHCTSAYPCPPEHVGLNNIPRDSRWQGLSDHTLGFAASLAAIALGASVIERHVCFDRRGYGTDCAHSLTLDEFGAFMKEVRALDVMLANPVDKDALARSPEMVRMRAAFLEQP